MLQSNLYEMPLLCGLSTWQMPSAACTHRHPFHWWLCKRGNFVLLSVLPAVYERRGAGERDHGAERKKCYWKKGRGQGRGIYKEREKEVMRYGMMKGRRITYRWNQESFGRSCLIINRTYFLFFVLSPILLNSSHHSFGRLASIINMQLSFRWWTDIRPFHRWMQPQRKDFPPDLCPGGMVSHNTHFTEFPTFWE